MQILAHENFPAALVAALRGMGHDVAWVWEDARGSKDQTILKRAQAEGRIVVTFDKDFGELAFRAGLPSLCGVRVRPLPGCESAQQT
jgi:predicted nuclease of predicted toxin-antitoxin system